MKITNEIREAFPVPDNVRKAVNDLTANLMHGPGHGSFSQETRDMVREWLDELPSPVYYNAMTGDVETTLPEDDGYGLDFLTEISDNEVRVALVGSEVLPYV